MTWVVVPKTHVPSRELADRHYSRQKDPGRCFLKAGWEFLHRTRDGLLVFGAPMPEVS